MRDVDPDYLAFIRSLPCLIPTCRREPCDPHHQNRRGHGSEGMRCSDYRAVPLCRVCHDDYHDRLSWQLYDQHGIDVELEICNLNLRYFFL